MVKGLILQSKTLFTTNTIIIPAILPERCLLVSKQNVEISGHKLVLYKVVGISEITFVASEFLYHKELKQWQQQQ